MKACDLDKGIFRVFLTLFALGFLVSLLRSLGDGNIGIGRFVFSAAYIALTTIGVMSGNNRRWLLYLQWGIILTHLFLAMVILFISSEGVVHGNWWICAWLYSAGSALPACFAAFGSGDDAKKIYTV